MTSSVSEEVRGQFWLGGKFSLLLPNQISHLLCGKVRVYISWYIEPQNVLQGIPESKSAELLFVAQKRETSYKISEKIQTYEAMLSQLNGT